MFECTPLTIKDKFSISSLDKGNYYKITLSHKLQNNLKFEIHYNNNFIILTLILHTGEIKKTMFYLPNISLSQNHYSYINNTLNIYIKKDFNIN